MLDFKLGIPYSCVFHVPSILNSLEIHDGYIFCLLLCDTFSIVYYSFPSLLAFEGQYLGRPRPDIWKCLWIRFYFDATVSRSPSTSKEDATPGALLAAVLFRTLFTAISLSLPLFPWANLSQPLKRYGPSTPDCQVGIAHRSTHMQAADNHCVITA